MKPHIELDIELSHAEQSASLIRRKSTKFYTASFTPTQEFGPAHATSVYYERCFIVLAILRRYSKWARKLVSEAAKGFASSNMSDTQGLLKSN